MYKSIVEIRQEFLNFFKKKSHQIISSSSLVPQNDPTLLFTNSGMNQFKNIFLGIEKPLCKRIVTIQRCMRAGGKHNDLNNVGYTDRHLTFFEMLGNFSFGDYFKSDAIQFAWELLTHNNWFNLSKDRIWATTHVCDDESYNLWKKHIGLSDKHIVKIGDKNRNFCDSDNFWQMGNVGPCGVCSEIFYDRGHDFQGNPPGDIAYTGNRYIEIWNLVFIQFNREINGTLKELTMPSVDTGMGLERITSIIQNVSNNYCIDVFKNLIIDISFIMKIDRFIDPRSIYVIADHIRACVFLIEDGIIPSNEGRGYVLRRIIRRAICHGKKLGINSVFLYKLVTPLMDHMQYINDVFHNQKDFIEQIILNEEVLFKNTLQKGLELLENELKKLKDKKILNGNVAFRLYTTYGFPIELTEDICYEHNIQIDHATFNQMMLEEKKSSKQSSRFYINSDNILSCNFTSKFIGYNHVSSQSQVLGLIQNNKLVNTIRNGQKGIVILNITPFYAESGGQIGDIGYLKTKNNIFEVINTKKNSQIIMHEGYISRGIINVGDQVYAEIDQLRRKKISINHSVTHLLHASLLKILGLHVMQKGSLVHDSYLRFDFIHDDALTESQIRIIENLINQQIWNNLSIVTETMTIESARNSGIRMLLHTQYSKIVQVLRIGDFSVELCGGTHAQSTGEIGLCIITKELGIGSGIRRIEAVTENVALSMIQNKKFLLQNIVQTMYSDEQMILKKIHALQLCHKKLSKQIKYFKNQQEQKNLLSYIKDVRYIKNIPVLIKQVEHMKIKTLSNTIIYLNAHLISGIIILIHMIDNTTCQILISVTLDLIEKYNISALKLIQNMIHSFGGGKGGGKSDFAQAKINNVITESDAMMKIHMLL